MGYGRSFMIRKKQSEDPLWQAPTVIFSGHEVPVMCFPATERPRRLDIF